jgi:hypothetical protein
MCNQVANDHQGVTAVANEPKAQGALSCQLLAMLKKKAGLDKEPAKPAKSTSGESFPGIHA